jgi:hypothetical protein
LAINEKPICFTSPTVTIEEYIIDYSGGAETSDDQSFKGSLTCDNKSLSGRFSYGNETGRLYWLEPNTTRWQIVY